MTHGFEYGMSRKPSLAAGKQAWLLASSGQEFFRFAGFVQGAVNSAPKAAANLLSKILSTKK